jgi:hypothetical protein
MKNKKANVNDLAILIIVPLLASVLCWVINLNMMSATLLFFGVPAAYLSWRKPAAIKRNLIFSGTFVLIAYLGDLYAVSDKAWYTTTIFNFRLPGGVPIEDLVWFFLCSYLIIAFYELFFDHLSHRTLGRRMILLYALVSAAALVVIVLFLLHGNIGTISYFYLKSCIILGIIPLTTFLIEYPRYFGVFLKMTSYFVCLFLLNEIVANHSHHWFFLGQHYIGKVNLGPYPIPLEEMVFYIILLCSITISYFELFDDNRLKFKIFKRG